jgi:hypothetical protein
LFGQLEQSQELEHQKRNTASVVLTPAMTASCLFTASQLHITHQRGSGPAPSYYRACVWQVLGGSGGGNQEVPQPGQNPTAALPRAKEACGEPTAKARARTRNASRYFLTTRRITDSIEVVIDCLNAEIQKKSKR